jgi:hypothetical protein
MPIKQKLGRPEQADHSLIAIRWIVTTLEPRCQPITKLSSVLELARHASFSSGIPAPT